MVRRYKNIFMLSIHPSLKSKRLLLVKVIQRQKKTLTQALEHSFKLGFRFYQNFTRFAAVKGAYNTGSFQLINKTGSP
jgi:hypothetical protein